jgi:hypothetical protein
MPKKLSQRLLITDVWYPSQVKAEETSFYREPMSDSRWQAICEKLQARVLQLPQEQPASLLRQIYQGIQWLDQPMTDFCQATCPTCADPCCTGRAIFFNQADILCLVARRGANLPPGQTRAKAEELCRYLGSDGCRLDRYQRPYVCVWFLCEPQMDIFNTLPSSFQRQFINVLRNIRICRLQLESLYEEFLAGAKDPP